jgi:hypothetical protein
MIFMSQSGITDHSRESDWDAWYNEHLRIMCTVPGIGSAQRFKTSTPGYSPSLAMYSIASAQVFTDPYYQSVRGMGDWLPLIDRQYYQRNLFQGMAHAPTVADGQTLLVADAAAPRAMPAGAQWTWLECVGLDRTTPYRGIAVVAAADAARLAQAAGSALYERATATNIPR